MKLKRLYLDNYKVLREIDIRFNPGMGSSNVDSNYAIDFLVGLNGSGKSTVLQAIIDIFLRLEKSEQVPFLFTLEYDVGVGDSFAPISISNMVPDEDEQNYHIGPIRIQMHGIDSDWSNTLLPDRIVAFTTGSEEGWEDIFRRQSVNEELMTIPSNLSPEERAIREQPRITPAGPLSVDDAESGKSQVEFVRAHELSAVTLCGLLDHLAQENRSDKEGLSSVLEQSSLKRMAGFSIRFRVNKGIITENQYNQILLLKSHAKRALRMGSDRLLVFNLSNNGDGKAKAILEDFSSGYQLFRTLTRMHLKESPSENVLQEINIFLERQPNTENESGSEASPLHLFSWLSDGEQSFIGRMCLFSLFRQSDALILLDEPEVHFNDYWKRHVVKLLDDVLKNQSSHVLISSHSSITLSDVPREDIIVLQRSGAFTSEANFPSIPTLAANPGDIMVHVFDTKYSSGEHAVEMIQEALRERPLDERGEQVRVLKKLLDKVSPGYWGYRIRKALKTLEG
jgi:predicted ATP-dependent endonuclease of OLD family